MKRRRNEKIIRVLWGTLTIGALLGCLVTFSLSYLAAANTKEESDKKVAELEDENKKLKARLTIPTYSNGGEGEEKDSETSAGAQNWNNIFVNEEHPIDTAYVPELVEVIGGYQVDARVGEAAKKMLEDAGAQGLDMVICSAYRSHEQQKEVFNQTMQDWIDQGYTYIDAYLETKKSVAVPGCSEHALGLAMDIVSADYGELDEAQANTDEAKWLAENCYKYGFILRYPPEKSDVTGIVYEPWHYRYVGEELAKELTESGMTLEEYYGDVIN